MFVLLKFFDHRALIKPRTLGALNNDLDGVVGLFS